MSKVMNITEFKKEIKYSDIIKPLMKDFKEVYINNDLIETIVNVDGEEDSSKELKSFINEEFKKIYTKDYKDHKTKNVDRTKKKFEKFVKKLKKLMSDISYYEDNLDDGDEEEAIEKYEKATEELKELFGIDD